MAIYLYPNLPTTFNANDQLVFRYTGKVQKLDLTTLGIERCEIMCYGGGPTTTVGTSDNNKNETVSQQAYMTKAEVNFANLIAKDVTELYVVVGASSYQSGGGCHIVMGGGEEYPSFGGVANTCGGSTDIRTFYEGNLFDNKSRKSAIISAAGNGYDGSGKGLGNKIVLADENDGIGCVKKISSGTVTRVSAHGWVIITVKENPYKLSNYKLEMKTSNGIKTFPLYEDGPKGCKKEIEVKLPDGKNAFACLSNSKPSPDNINIKNPSVRYVTASTPSAEADVGDDGEIIGTGTKVTSIPSGKYTLYMGDIFRVPDGVTRIYISNTFTNGESWHNYYTVSPGQIITSRFYYHRTYYDHDLSWFLLLNNGAVTGQGDVPEHGWLAPGPFIIQYGPSLEKTTKVPGGLDWIGVFNNTGDLLIKQKANVYNYKVTSDTGSNVVWKVTEPPKNAKGQEQALPVVVTNDVDNTFVKKSLKKNQTLRVTHAAGITTSPGKRYLTDTPITISTPETVTFDFACVFHRGDFYSDKSCQLSTEDGRFFRWENLNTKAVQVAITTDDTTVTANRGLPLLQSLSKGKTFDIIFTKFGVNIGTKKCPEVTEGNSITISKPEYIIIDSTFKECQISPNEGKFFKLSAQVATKVTIKGNGISEVRTLKAKTDLNIVFSGLTTMIGTKKYTAKADKITITKN